MAHRSEGGGSGWREAVGAALTRPPSSPARLIQHTKDLMESEEKLCVKVLRTLQQMLLKKTKYGDRVSAQASWMPGGLARSSRGSGPGLSGQWLHGLMYQRGALLPSSQGNQLRKMLLQNYLQNRKSSSRGDLPDPVGIGQYCLPCCASG